jgi:hypothetical protein
MERKRKKRAFRPVFGDASHSLEHRVVMSGFMFPTAIVGPVTTLGHRGSRVLTSRTYEQVQASVDKAFKQFAKDFTRAWQAAARAERANPGSFSVVLDKHLGIPLGSLTSTGVGQYRSGMLGRIDRIMQQVETKLPFGRGLSGNTGGVGLSTLTDDTATASPTGLSVAEMLDEALGSSTTSVGTVRDGLAAIEQIRRASLKFLPDRVSGIEIGILPGYVAAHGPAGTGEFGIRNS